MSTPTRKPYHGSCHCGATRYLIFLTLPHTAPPAAAKFPPAAGTPVPQMLYRCNCTICQKTGFFHVRVPFAPDDFFVLSPGDPLVEQGDYQRGAKKLHFLFCKGCGVRTFTFMGEGERVVVDLGALGVEGEGVREVWRPKREGWVEGRANGTYLSVNGQTVEAGQGVDLGRWVDERGVLYYDYLELGGVDAKAARYEGPHEYGCW